MMLRSLCFIYSDDYDVFLFFVKTFCLTCRPTMTVSEFTHSVLVLRLSLNWIGREECKKVKTNIKSCTYSVDGISTMLTLC